MLIHLQTQANFYTNKITFLPRGHKKIITKKRNFQNIKLQFLVTNFLIVAYIHIKSGKNSILHCEIVYTDIHIYRMTNKKIIYN